MLLHSTKEPQPEEEWRWPPGRRAVAQGSNAGVPWSCVWILDARGQSGTNFNLGLKRASRQSLNSLSTCLWVTVSFQLGLVLLPCTAVQLEVTSATCFNSECWTHRLCNPEICDKQVPRPACNAKQQDPTIRAEARTQPEKAAMKFSRGKGWSWGWRERYPYKKETIQRRRSKLTEWKLAGRQTTSRESTIRATEK